VGEAAFEVGRRVPGEEVAVDAHVGGGRGRDGIK
jgi:hypothetical protein